MESWVFWSGNRNPACRAGNRHTCAPQTLVVADGSGWRQEAGPRSAGSTLQAAFSSPPPTLFLAGDIDESSYRDLREVLKLATATRYHQLNVDMAQVEYCDLAGLRAIVLLAQGDQRGPASVDQLVLRHLPVHLGTVIRVLGWDATPGLSLAEPAC